MHPPSRVPITLITGLTGADKRAFILALLAARPAEQQWALLDNDDAGFAHGAAGPQLAVSVVGGCACCTGQIALQTGIVKLIRQSRPQRLVIAAAGAAEPAALVRALQQEHLARSISVDHRLCVMPSPPMSALPVHTRELLQQQMAAADHVVCKNPVCGLSAGVVTPALQFADAIKLVLASPTPTSSASSRLIDS